MRDTAIRTALLARIQPLVDRLASDLAALAEKRIEAELERVGEVFEIALSAYQGNEPGPPRTPSIAEVRSRLGMRPVSPDTRRQSVAASIVDHKEPVKRPRAVPASTPPDGQTEDKPRLRSDGKRIGAIVCSKCGYVGGNARGCGTAHETVAAAEDLLEVNAPAQPSNATKLDRFARIEAAAAARRAGGM